MGLRAYIDHEQGWHKSLSNVPLKMCWGCPGMCSGRCRPKTGCQQPQQQRNHDHYSSQRVPFWGNRTPETNAYIFEVYTRTHRCWLIQLRKRSLKPSTVHYACERERCYQCHQGKTGFTGTAGKLIGASCWYDVVDNGTTIYVRGACVFATNIRLFPRWRHGALPVVY